MLKALAHFEEFLWFMEKLVTPASSAALGLVRLCSAKGWCPVLHLGCLFRPTTGEMNVLEMAVTEAAGLGGYTIVFVASISSTGQVHYGYWGLWKVPWALFSGAKLWPNFLMSWAYREVCTVIHHDLSLIFFLFQFFCESHFCLCHLKWRLLNNWENWWIWWTRASWW